MTDYEKKMFDGLAAGATFMAVEIQLEGDRLPEKWMKFLKLWEKKLEAMGVSEDTTAFSFIDTAIDSYFQHYGDE